MPGLVDSFLDAYKTTVSLHNQREKEKRDAIQQEVENAFKQHQLEQTDAFRRDNLAATQDYRKSQIEDRNADNLRADKIEADRVAREAAKQQAADQKQAATEQKYANDAKIKARQQFGATYPKSGDTRQVAMDAAGVDPTDQQAILNSALQAMAANVSKQNAGAQQRADAGAYGPTQTGGNLVEFAPQPTLEDAQNEVSPAFQRTQNLANSLIEHRGVLNEMDNARKDLYEQAMTLNLTKNAADVALKHSQQELADARAKDLPLARKYDQAYKDAKLNVDWFNAQTQRWKAESAQVGPNSVAARQEANAMRQYLGRENNRIGTELMHAKAAEHSAAQEHQFYGNVIQTLYQKSQTGQITPQEQADLQAARIQWQTGEQTLPQKTAEVQRIQAEQSQVKSHLQQLLGIDQIPLTTSGQPAKLPKFSGGNTLPQIGGLGPMPIDPSAGARLRPTGPPTPVTRQFRNKKTGAMETFTLKNGQWIK